MVRGNTSFTCSECGTKFRAPDIELAASSYSMPQPCPNCKSHRTYPTPFWSIFSSSKKKAYEKIWEMQEKQ